MRRLGIGLLAAATVAWWPGQTVSAAGDLLFGQQHSYSVTYRGNGESVTTARLVVTNHNDRPKTNFAFEAPGLDITDILGFQQTSTSQKCVSYTPVSGTGVRATPPCLEYAQPDYTQASSYYDATVSTDYKKLTIKRDGNRFSFDLPTPVAVNQSTAFILSYAGKGYARAAWGGYDLQFQTLKVDERISSATVAVDVDSDLFLKDATSQVNYTQGGNGSAAQLDASIANTGASSKALDSVVSAIGQGGGFTKTAKDLATGDTLTVKGRYADAAWKLNLAQLAIAAGVLAFIIVVVILFVLWNRRRVGRNAATRHPEAADMSVAHQRQTMTWQTVASPVYVIAGLLTAVMLAAITWGIQAYSNETSYGSSDTFTSMLVAILAILAYVLAVFGPVVWLAVRAKNWKVAVVVVSWQIFWLVVVLFVYVLAIRPLLADPATSSGRGYLECPNC